MAKVTDLQEVNIGVLKKYKNNPRTHSPEQIEKIKESISGLGFLTPCLIDKDFNLIAGHGRVQAAEELGMETVPCVFIEGLSDAERRAYIIIDNKITELGGWDERLLAEESEALKDLELDIDVDSFDVNINIDEELEKIIEDKPTEAEEEPKAKIGEIYQLGKHRLMCGDSTKAEDVEKLMNREKADMVLTDPPYNVAYEDRTNTINERLQREKMHRSLSRKYNIIENDKLDDAQFRDFLCAAFTQMKAALKKGGAFYIWYANREAENFYGALHEVGLENRETIIWVKNTLALGMQDYQHREEPCIYGWNSGAGHYFRDTRKETTVIDDTKNLKTKSKEDLIDILQNIYDTSNVIYENKPLKSDLHPTMKPVALMARLIINSSREDELVLDLFGGSGSTLIAAEQTGRRCYMMEYDPRYIDVIIKRWENYTGEKAVLLNGE